MAIQVTCPGCLKRFQVSDKFAGKTGPCPQCKATIRIPDKSEQVVIHAPETGPKDSQGRPVLKPITFSEAKLTRKALITLGVAIVAALIGAIALRVAGTTAAWNIVPAAILLGPPLAWVGYFVARDPELEGYSGREAWMRALVCGLLFSLLWLIYWWVPAYVMEVKTVAELSPVVAAASLVGLLALGGLISVLAFELEYFNGVLHCGVYLASTLLLALIAGVQLMAPLGSLG